MQRAGAAWNLAAERPRVTVAALILLALVIIGTITAVAGVQEPEIHDELTQLTMADIYAHGRLCEPRHPHWPHFEANFFLSHPCFQGKYPPGPALFIALGIVLADEPIVGVWLSIPVMIAAVAYAMYAWLPARWALLGTVLLALRFGIAGDWAHSYWGGAVAAAGGALVLGGVRYLTLRPNARDGALFAAGLLLLALSRPYEGLAFSLPALALIGWRLLRPWPGRAAMWRMAVPAIAVVAGTGLGWLGYYNLRVTGSPLTLPYALYERTHTSEPLFVWQEFRPPPVIRNAQMAAAETYLIEEGQRSRRNWPIEKLKMMGPALWDFVKPTFLFAGLGLFFLPRQQRGPMAFIALSFGLAVFASSLASALAAERYLAPATSAIFLLVTMGLAGLTRRQFGIVPGWTAAAAIVVLFAMAVTFAIAMHVVRLRTSREWWAGKRDVREHLLRTPGDDLVFVRYGPEHPRLDDWVYNGADLDRQPLVWARELDPESDSRLRAYFSQRKAWIVMADEQPPRLVEWPGLQP